MQKFLRVAALCVCFALLSGCALVSVNKEKEAAEIVAQVGSEQLTRGEVEPILTMYYQYYGIPMDDSGKASRDQLKGMLVDDYVRLKVEEALAKEKGLYEATQAEQDAARQQVTEDKLQELKLSMAEDKANDPSLDVDKKAKEQLDKYIAENESVFEAMVKDGLQQVWMDKLKADVTRDVAVTDKDVQDAYDKILAEQPSTYAAKPAQYGKDRDAGSIIVSVPSGYRRVKHILIALTDEEMQQINAQRYSQQEAQTAGDTAKAASYQESGDKLLLELLALHKDRAQEALDKVNAGGDFDALIAEYNDDPGMMDEPAKTEGYFICAASDFTKPFLDGAFTLSQPGQNTGLVASDYGYHIIKYVADVEARTVPFAEVKDTLQAQTLADAQDKLYTSVIDEKLKNTTVRKYLNRLP